MNKKKWTLLLSCIGLLLGYFKLFYKTWSNDTVAKNADCIIALDVKRITNTAIWNFITTPSQWKNSNIFSSSNDDKVSWDDMVKLPDYVLIFHPASQPANAWYTVLEINDEGDFAKGLQQFHFEKRGSNEYVSAQTGIEFIQNGNWLLAGNAGVENKQYIRQMADVLFTKKQYIAKEVLQKSIDAASHLAVQISSNNFLQEAAIITANFDKATVAIEAVLSPKKEYSFNEGNFSYSDSSLCSLAFAQPAPALYGLLSDSTRAGISRAVNFNIDSLLLPTNTMYQLDLAAIVPRVDSAVSYTYDDNFNPIEKVVVNNVEEPVFNFLVNGKGLDNIYNYWSNAGKLENTEAGVLFTPMPFVKSYCKKTTDQQLAVTSSNYKAPAAAKNTSCIFLLNVLLTRIPASLLKYLPDDVVKAMKNLASIHAIAKKENGQILLRLNINKKKNELPIIEW